MRKGFFFLWRERILICQFFPCSHSSEILFLNRRHSNKYTVESHWKKSRKRNCLRIKPEMAELFLSPRSLGGNGNQAREDHSWLQNFLSQRSLGSRKNYSENKSEKMRNIFLHYCYGCTQSSFREKQKEGEKMRKRREKHPNFLSIFLQSPFRLLCLVKCWQKKDFSRFFRLPKSFPRQIFPRRLAKEGGGWVKGGMDG